MARLKPITKLVFVTKNINKLDELRYLLGTKGYTVLGVDKLGDVPPYSTKDTSFLGCAEELAMYYSKFTDLPIIADKDGIEVETGFNEYAVYYKEDDIFNSMVDSINRKCRFHAALCVVKNCKRICFAEGICDGKISKEKRGTRTKLPFDSIFIPNHCRLTFAEQGVEIKSLRSPMGIAIRSIVAQLEDIYGKRR